MIVNVAIALVLVFIAAASNAVMDTLAHHYNKSVFLGLDEKFWKPGVSWRRKYEISRWIPDSLSDGWHIFKTLMIFALVGLALVQPPSQEWYRLASFYGLLGLTWNWIFNLFYNELLIVDKDK